MRPARQLSRIKGIVDVEGRDKLLVIHGVQHMLFPTATLERWPAGARRSQLLFIVRSTEVEFISHTLDYFINHHRADQPDEAGAINEEHCLLEPQDRARLAVP